MGSCRRIVGSIEERCLLAILTIPILALPFTTVHAAEPHHADRGMCGFRVDIVDSSGVHLPDDRLMQVVQSYLRQVILVFDLCLVLVLVLLVFELVIHVLLVVGVVAAALS